MSAPGEIVTHLHLIYRPTMKNAGNTVTVDLSDSRIEECHCPSKLSPSPTYRVNVNNPRTVPSGTIDSRTINTDRIVRGDGK